MASRPGLCRGPTLPRNRAATVILIVLACQPGCSSTPTVNPETQAAIANCRRLPRGLGNYEQRARCELEVESRAYLAEHPEMAGTWRELINDTLAEYARADRAEQSIQQADRNAALLREAAEAGTGCLTDQCGKGSEWNFPSNPPY